MDLPDPKLGCHRTGFTKKCRKLVVDGICNRWVGIEGRNHKDEPVKPYDCVDNWLLTIALENSQQTRQAGASADKVATEIRNFHHNMIVANNMIEQSSQSKLLSKD